MSRSLIVGSISLNPFFEFDVRGRIEVKDHLCFPDLATIFEEMQDIFNPVVTKDSLQEDSIPFFSRRFLLGGSRAFIPKQKNLSLGRMLSFQIHSHSIALVPLSLPLTKS